MENVILILIALTAVLKSLALLMKFKVYLKHCYCIVWKVERRQKAKTWEIKEKWNFYHNVQCTMVKT